ncbi:MAG: c-type cytochrome biogenesis protein CcmI [Nitrosomonadales bacterium]|nr:c-type cytochrome biogenesis protein CcmI [Nitrosomonadales bacterium]
MTQFWIICALLLLVALAFVVVPLWRSRVKSNDVLRDVSNLEIYRDQLAEMDADLRNGLLTQELYDQGREELQLRLLDEVNSEEVTAQASRDPAKITAIVVALLLPLGAVFMYLQIGNLNAFLPQVSGVTADGFGVQRSEAALEELNKKLDDEPKNPEGWLVLARSYVELERYPEAVAAFKKLVQLVPDEAPVWADYADALAMANGQSLAGEPTKLLDKALAIDPNNAKALALAGSAAMERGDYSAAIRHWENLVKLMPKDSEDARMVEGGIQQAREFQAQVKGGKAPAATQQAPQPPAQQAAPAGGRERITGSVEIDPALLAQASPEDTVFILARAAEGPKMPLAILRAQVKNLPAQFALDDSLAMSPQMKISNFDQVVIVARVSKSGQATPQPGDIQGESAPVKPGSKGLKITIDHSVK